MLAREFLMAKQLKCAEVDRQAAIELLDMLEGGELEYVEMGQDRRWIDNRRQRWLVDGKEVIIDCADELGPNRGSVNFLGFVGPGPTWKEYMMPHGSGLNMLFWGDQTAGDYCGCLGGWMERLKGRELSERTLIAWQDLFHPADIRQPENFPPARCARALRAKLATGRADWS